MADAAVDIEGILLDDRRQLIRREVRLTGDLMLINEFVWLPEIIDKLEAKHRVSQDEVEEVFFAKPKYRFVESGHRAGENVYSAGGQTISGRYLMVFFIHKSDNSALILTARDMDSRERKRHGRK